MDVVKEVPSVVKEQFSPIHTPDALFVDIKEHIPDFLSDKKFPVFRPKEEIDTIFDTIYNMPSSQEIRFGKWIEKDGITQRTGFFPNDVVVTYMRRDGTENEVGFDKLQMLQITQHGALRINVARLSDFPEYAISIDATPLITPLFEANGEAAFQLNRTNVTTDKTLIHLKEGMLTNLVAYDFYGISQDEILKTVSDQFGELKKRQATLQVLP